jgi:SAM-dependent methyltransferase
MGSNWSDRRVVVTGLGCVSSLGTDADTVWRNVLAGKCGIDRVTRFDITGYDCQIAAEVRDFDPTPGFPDRKEVRRTDRFTHFGVYAGWGALKDSGLELEKENLDEIGVFLGSGIGGLVTAGLSHWRTRELWWTVFHLVMPWLALLALQWQLPLWIYPALALLLLAVFSPVLRDRVPFFLSSDQVAQTLLQVMGQRQTRSFVDLGCATGGLLVRLARSRPQTQFVGVETAWLPYWVARMRAMRLPNLTIRRQSIWDLDLKGFDLVYCFLSPDPMQRLAGQFDEQADRGACLISNSFQIPGLWEPTTPSEGRVPPRGAPRPPRHVRAPSLQPQDVSPPTLPSFSIPMPIPIPIPTRAARIGPSGSSSVHVGSGKRCRWLPSRYRDRNRYRDRALFFSHPFVFDSDANIDAHGTCSSASQSTGPNPNHAPHRGPHQRQRRCVL